MTKCAATPHVSVRVKIKPVTRLGWHPVDEWWWNLQEANIETQSLTVFCFLIRRWKTKCLLCLFLVNHLRSPHRIRETTANPPVLISAVIPHSCAHSPHFSSLHSVPLSFITSPYVDSRTLLFPCLILLTQHQPNEVRYTAGLIGGDGQSLLAKTINKMDHALSPGGFQTVVWWGEGGYF